MRKLILPALAALAWAVVARGDSPQASAGSSVPAPLVREVSARAAERGIPVAEVLAPLREAAAHGVPVDLVAAKVLEGISKGVPAARVGAVARDLTSRLAAAGDLLRKAERARLTPAVDHSAALLDLSAALASGVGREELESLIDSARGGPGASTEAVVSAALTVGELARREVPRDDAMSLGKAIARHGPRQPGEISSLFDAWRAEGGKDARAFVTEARRRVENGRELTGMVDPFGESPDRVVVDRGVKDDDAASGLAGSDVGKRGADHGVGPAERPDVARGAVPGLDNAARGKGKAKEKGPKK
jgi:hypothetical protein